nr:PREDICTED: BTB/POZ domain-containing protein 2-like [Bemisia tabaci]
MSRVTCPLSALPPNPSPQPGLGAGSTAEETAQAGFVDDAVLVASSEDDLQRMLHSFNLTAKTFNMKVSAKKTKRMVTSKNPIRCKLAVDGTAVEQIKQEVEDPSDLPNDWQGDKQVLAEGFAFICNSEKYADIHILVGKTEQRIPAHKLILCVGSAVLDDILSKNGKFEMLMIPDIEPDTFLVLLKFLYSDVPAVTIDNVMDVLDAAKTYAVPTLVNICHDRLRDNLKVSSVFLILSKAVHFDENKIRDDCLSIIDNETKEAIETDEFTSNDLNTLCLILERNSLKIKEYDLLRATLRWSEAECNRRNLTINSENRSSVSGYTYRLRYPLLSSTEFSSCVAGNGLLADKDFVHVFVLANKASGALPPANFIATPR